MKIMKLLGLAVLAIGLWQSALAAEKFSRGQIPPPASEWSGKITDAARLPVEENAWGTLQWICSGKLLPGATQTVGITTILPGKQNPVHYHPNCEEILYVISGQGLHSYNGRSVELKAGMTIRIPPKVKHNLVNTGSEPLRTFVSFSSGNRQAVFLPDQPAK
jgi:mannose-6-phosphate isomerase-like protein (cupin superfamily)